MTASLAPHIVDILTEPVYGSLGTIRTDDTVQVNPMWFELIDGTIRFTHTNKRAKFRNLQRNPSMSFMVSYPGDPYRYIELRGSLIEAIPDPTGAFYVQLSKRYGNVDPQAPADSPDRVILVMGIDKVIDG
jgi:PPOX class probable F420-dependent enzyme